MSQDPKDPRTWWRLFVDAVIGLQRGEKKAATAYLQFTQLHRGQEQALAAQKRLPEVAASEAFENAHEWPANGYAATKKRKVDHA